jgi:hypothetical protein
MRHFTTRSEHGEASLAEVAVALFVTVVIAPTFAIATAVGWQYLLSSTAQATVSSQGGQLLTTVVQELNGAQPVGDCPDAPGSGASPSTPAQPLLQLETYADQCPEPSSGPAPPPGGWGIQLPTPSTVCGTPVVTASAIVTATDQCVGFYAYNYEPTSTGNADFTPALSPSGPLAPPSLTYLWVCSSTCPNGVGNNSLWVTYYPSKGSYTNPGCPAESSTACSSPDWSTSTPRTRFIGSLSSTTGVLSYLDASGTQLDAPVSASDLPSVQVVNINAGLSSPGQTQSSSISVDVTGNTYQSQS